ncbi:MAG TPA: hypothetical protein PKC21_10745 [Oligoflexia bacterium]|nr:hypothetical protein [Oligoflexia bacterium]HMR25814.1 hypothetical protein [Oligoflexia bacterium]
MKKIQIKFLVGACLTGMVLSSCTLVQTPGTSEMKNLAKASPVVIPGSEGFAEKLSAAGTCDRGVAEINVMHDVGGLAKHEGAIFASGKAYFTSEPWDYDEVNPFHALGYDKGEATFPKGANPSIPFAAKETVVVAKFFTGKNAAKNMIAEGKPLDQARALGLEAIIDQAKRREAVSEATPEEVDPEEVDPEEADSEAELAESPDTGESLFLDQSYSIDLVRGEGERLKNYYLGNLPEKDKQVIGFGQRSSQGKAVVYGEPTDGFGVGDFTHFTFGKEGFYGLYMVPADVESKEATLAKVINVEENDVLQFNIGKRGELPPATQTSYITVTLEHANKTDKLNPVRYHVLDEGQTAVAFQLAGVAPGEYNMIVQRGNLYSSPALDGAGGNYCVYATANASSKVVVVAKPEDA